MVRGKAQGVWNIIRFNWHFYFLAGLVSIIGIFLNSYFDGLAIISIVIALASTGIFISLAVSYYVYDFSRFYDLEWLKDINIKQHGSSLNIHAGFDETSELLKFKYPNAELTIWDFYDAKKHTEVSIKRARKAYPGLPSTLSVDTNKLPNDCRFDSIFLIFAAHEIRNFEERQLLFKQLNDRLNFDGKIIVVEHLRDVPNFLAYTIGFFHFYSKKSWLNIFSETGFKLTKEMKFTPFVSTFILSKK